MQRFMRSALGRCQRQLGNTDTIASTGWLHRRVVGQRRCITTNSNNPFHVLGVPSASSFQTVQKAFVKLALEHHPDTNGTNASKNGENISSSSSGDRFVRIRQAYERIRADHQQNNSSLETGSWTEDDFLNWFYEHTGLRLTSIQRRELVELHRSCIPGGRYDGPSWALAQRLVQEQDAFLRHKVQREQGTTATRKGPISAARHGYTRTSSSSGAPPKRSASSNLRRKRQR